MCGLPIRNIVMMRSVGGACPFLPTSSDTREGPSKQVIPKAIGKYILWGLTIYAIMRFYAVHPLYSEFTPNTRRFFNDFFFLFLILGLPYFFLAEKFRYCLDNAMGDPYLRILSLLRCLKNREFRLIGRRLAIEISLR